MPKNNVVAIDDSYSTGNVKTYWVVALAVWYYVQSPKLDNTPSRLRTIVREHHLYLLDELEYLYI